MRYTTATFAACLLAAGALAAAEGSEQEQPNAPKCCGAARARAAFQANVEDPKGSPIASDLSSCICLKYIISQRREGEITYCEWYATDCYGTPFMWVDSCDYQSQACDLNANPPGCGTCLQDNTSGLALQKEIKLSKPLGPDFMPTLNENEGARFFDEPFFLRVEIPGLQSPVSVKVFPISVRRRIIAGQELPARVFYEGVEVEYIPAQAKPRKVEGKATGRHGIRAIDLGVQIAIRTHTALPN